ncbi:pyrroline-5-carboxylate reductase [Rhizodiscina lignyota]|uniref:Pyrroline-5-carboxylate reductase n=1 Tax=Rhizodiscina lignyota TaxID=1504668 RepID=A0A9P4M632_9PEZI|nr:pyrroline-5-carboxylate reductase [Rhizodiscina lignyota]
MTHSPGSKNFRLAILGCGFMGTALLSGIIKALGDSPREQIKFSVSAPSQTSIQRLQQAFSSHRDQVDSITTDNVDAASGSDIIILAFQPQQLTGVLSDSALLQALQDKLIISVLAGVSSRQIIEAVYTSSELTRQSRVSRVIPSIGAQINESASLIAETSLSQSDRDLVAWLFQLVGRTVVVPEELIDTATAVSAACHALTIVAADAIVDGSVAEGIPRPIALDIASQSLRSSASMLQGHATIESLKDSLSIAKGITVNALLQLERGNMRSGISDAVRHAAQYAQAMSSGNE